MTPDQFYMEQQTIQQDPSEDSELLADIPEYHNTPEQENKLLQELTIIAAKEFSMKYFSIDFQYLKSVYTGPVEILLNSELHEREKIQTDNQMSMFDNMLSWNALYHNTTIQPTKKCHFMVSTLLRHVLLQLRKPLF